MIAQLIQRADSEQSSPPHLRLHLPRRRPALRMVRPSLLDLRFTGDPWIVDRKDGDGLQSMRPVWCFFGGEGSAAVLALCPLPNPIMIGGEPYTAVLVPSAPVPVGGALIYVPTKWVKPADIGVELLTSVYVSMGMTPPPAPRAGDALPAA